MTDARLTRVALILALSCVLVQCKVFTRCQLTRELLKNNYPRTFLSNWVCLIEQQSDRNTSAFVSKSPRRKYYGLFQIGSEWCKEGRKGGKCDISCEAYPGLQSTIILLVGQNIRQLRILTFILLNLDELISELGLRHWQICCTDVLAQCVDQYVKIKSFSNRLNMICRPFYLTLILVAIMLVCMCSVKIAVSNKLAPDTMKYYVHEICFIIVVLMFCLLGQQIENECEKLEQAVTEKWYIYDKRHKTDVRIFKTALSQRMPIYIFGTIPLSLPTFTWFIKTGMSFFTLVMSVLEEQ